MTPAGRHGVTESTPAKYSLGTLMERVLEAGFDGADCLAAARRPGDEETPP